MVIRDEYDAEVARAIRAEFLAREGQRAQAVGGTAELARLRRRLAKIDGALAVEETIAATKLEAKLRASGFRHARIAPLRRSHFEHRKPRPNAGYEPEPGQRGGRRTLYRNLGQVMRVW
jgi:hypothetical protein